MDELLHSFTAAKPQPELPLGLRAQLELKIEKGAAAPPA
jgi:hypothetical protein